MKDPIVFLDDIQSSFRKNKIVTLSMVTASVIIAVASVFMSYWYVKQNEDKIFVVDEGYVLAASRQNNMVQRDLEVINHVTRFHELMYNLAPDITAIQSNVDKASELGINCAMEIDRTRTEAQFYSQLIQMGGVEEISIDSVKVDISRYPYIARTYAKLYFVRSSNISLYDFESVCSLVNVTRTPNNPNGLMIEKFLIQKQEQVKTAKR